jgi:hypothetical protein
MRPKRQRKLGVALGLASLLCAPAVAAASTAFLCRDDSIVRNECCCPGGHHSLVADAAAFAHLSAACCCDLVQPQASVPSPGASALTNEPVGRVAALGQVSPWPLLPPGNPRSAVFHLAHPPPLAVPILLGKQSFLI